MHTNLWEHFFAYVDTALGEMVLTEKWPANQTECGFTTDWLTTLSLIVLK